MAIEELAFKDYQELKDIQKIDLLLIIEFLQKDRKQWINQYSKAHNDYVDLQQENQELKDRIDKAKKYIETYSDYNVIPYELYEILKGEKE